MKVESIAECSPWSILQYFWTALSDNWSWKPIFRLFESGRFTQVWLYSVFVLLQVHQHVRHAKKNLVSRRVVTEHFIPDNLPGGIWKVSKTRDVSQYRGLNATLSYLAFMKFFRRVKKHIYVLAFIIFFTIL